VTRLDEMLNAAFERQARERAEAEIRRAAQRDPFKPPRAEPGRARPHHGNGQKFRAPTSLGGEHS
jgi:hypothetical protein